MTVATHYAAAGFFLLLFNALKDGCGQSGKWSAGKVHKLVRAFHRETDAGSCWEGCLIEF